MPEWIVDTVDGEPVTQWEEVFEACRKHQRASLVVEKYDEQKAISRQQMAYLHAVVFPTLANEMSCSKGEAEFVCKVHCGEEWLVKEACGARFILSKTSLTTAQCNAWIENIWDWADRSGIHIPAPDKDWRLHENVEDVKEQRT